MAPESQLIPLPDLPKLIAQRTGSRKRPHVRTVYRWATKGVRGRRLRTLELGGVLATRSDWLDEFFAERNPAPRPTPSPARRQMTARDHAAETERARRDLQEAGVL